MKRTNLVLDEKVLEQARRLFGERTYSATVNRALADVVQRADLVRLYQKFHGSGGWEGDLGEMRGDQPRRKTKSPK